jgi:nicotinamidase-related amidase
MSVIDRTRDPRGTNKQNSGARTAGDGDVLVIVDVQNDFCPSGALAVPDGEVVIPVINLLAAWFAHLVLTQDWHPPWHTSFAGSHPGKQPFEDDRRGLRLADPVAGPNLRPVLAVRLISTARFPARRERWPRPG